MESFKVTVVLALLGVALALPQYSPAPAAPAAAPAQYGSSEPVDPASYTFSYDANDAQSGNQYGHAEQRDGPQSSGEYRVLLPDGRTQVVQYSVEGDSGYVAKVSYEGNAAPAPGSYQ
ncbi:pro-resilin-like [Penaeus japonicus]|uniref:pro-resilin-like n=1 Tax=Penaeus japonicus TaxID=27405 RepID=UPI001C710ED1|nr:pro-resilin-like [Penaeus japonicus]